MEKDGPLNFAPRRSAPTIARSSNVKIVQIALPFLDRYDLAFAERFRIVGTSTSAFGANFLGAIVGGVLEYSALMVGYRSLVLLVGFLYAAAFFFGRQRHEVRP